MLHDKAQKVKYVLNSHFGGNINSDTPHVTEHVNLLERASPVLTAGVTTNSIICYQGKSIFSLGLLRAFEQKQNHLKALNCALCVVLLPDLQSHKNTIKCVGLGKQVTGHVCS